MTAEKATKLGHDQVMHVEACFVIILLTLNNLSAAIFAYKMAMTLVDSAKLR